MQNRKDSSPWKAAALVSAIGADLVVCMALGYWIGSRISEAAGGRPIWIVAGIMAGFFVGAASVILILRKMTESADE
jgi:F0F1-type ATP synthase assembly protein I